MRDKPVLIWLALLAAFFIGNFMGRSTTEDQWGSISARLSPSCTSEWERIVQGVNDAAEARNTGQQRE